MDAANGEEAEKQPPFSLLNLDRVPPWSSSQTWSLACKRRAHKTHSTCGFLLEMTAFCTRQHCSHNISTKCRKMWLSNTVADHLLTPSPLPIHPPTPPFTSRYVSRALLCCISYNFIMQTEKKISLGMQQLAGNLYMFGFQLWSC